MKTMSLGIQISLLEYAINLRLEYHMLAQYCHCQCYKDDIESMEIKTESMEEPEIRPRHLKTCEPMITKIAMCDCIPDTYGDAKFHYNAMRGFCPHICLSCLPSVHSVTFWVLITCYPKADVPILTLSTSKDVVSCKDVPSEGPQKKFYILTPFPAKRTKFSVGTSAQNRL